MQQSEIDLVGNKGRSVCNPTVAQPGCGFREIIVIKAIKNNTLLISIIVDLAVALETIRVTHYLQLSGGCSLLPLTDWMHWLI